MGGSSGRLGEPDAEMVSSGTGMMMMTMMMMVNFRSYSFTKCVDDTIFVQASVWRASLLVGSRDGLLWQLLPADDTAVPHDL